MANLQRVGILLRDSEESDEHNIRIMEYLNDRIHYLNDAGYAIAIDIVSDDNLNSFVRKGIVSIPALVLDDETEYGVNAIIATLAKLEVANPPKSKKSKFLSRDDADPDEEYRDKILKEMMSGEEDPKDEIVPSSTNMRGQDMDMPPSKQELAAKMAKYDAIYASRNKKGPPSGRKSVAPPVAKAPSAKQNVEKLIAKEGYDAAEAAFMRDIASRLE